MKQVRIAELKAKLSEHLRGVRRGHSIVVMDRDTPIARLGPHTAEDQEFVVREPLRNFRTLGKVPLPARLELDLDVLNLLLEERQGER